MKTEIHLSSLLLSSAAVTCAVVAFGGSLFADAPSVDWASSPVKPGEHVLLNGGGWDANAVVEIGGRRVKPDRVTEAGLVFAYPSAKEEVLSGRVIAKGGVSEPFVLNAPDVWWLHGDESDYSTPGGWLRVFGSALRGGKVKVKSVELPLSRVDDYELAAKVPADLPCGEYSVEVKSAISGWTKAGTWKVAAPRQLWKKDVFNVLDFGAVPDDGLDDSLAFTNALAAAGRNGGGIVHFPRGTFDLAGTFEVPAHVLVRGESQDRSRLDWGDMLEPPHYLLVVDHSFGLEDLTVHTGFNRGFLAHRNGAVKDAVWWGAFRPKTHDLVFKNLTLRFVTDEHRDRMTEREFLRRYWWSREYPYGMNGVPLKLQDVERCTLENVDLYQDKNPNGARFFILTGWYMRISKCKFHGGGWTEFGGRKFIFEDTENRCCTHSLTAISSHGYFARNVGYDNFKNDGEGFTHDSQCWIARGKGRVDGTSVTLDYGEKRPNRDRDHFLADIGREKDIEIQIVAGRGAGQVRRIVAMPDWEHVTVDRPFGTQPDETSLFNIAFQRYKMLWLDNEMIDATVGLQLWGDGDDYILARNRLVRAGGIRVDGLGMNLPCFRVQVLDNVIESDLGRNSRGVAVEGTTWAAVVRRNVIESNAAMSISGTDGLVEGNVFRNTTFAFDSKSGTFFLGENMYENVDNPFRNTAKAVLSEEAKAAHAAWCRKLAARLGSGRLPKREAAALFGLKAGVQTGSPLMKAARAGGTTKPFELPLTVSHDPMSPAVSVCEVIASASGGWTFRMKNARLNRTGTGQWGGTIEITPSGKETGVFTIPLTVRLSGEGWQTEAKVDAATFSDLSDNALPLEWRYAVVEGAEYPKDDSKLVWKKVVHFVNGGIDTAKYDLDPEFKKGKDSMIFEQRWEVSKRLTAGIRVYDPSREIYLDGRKIVLAPSYDALVKVVELEPGVHTIRVFRPHPGPMESWRPKRLMAYILLPRGAEPGAYRVLPAEEGK